VTAGAVPFDELEDKYIWLLQYERPWNSLRWSGGERLTQFTPPDDINGLIVVRYSKLHTQCNQRQPVPNLT
jgi:hypothetical protein